MIAIKRSLSFSRTSDEQIKKFRQITCLENLANELFYEIFDYLDGCDIHQAFSNLNNRFQNLINSLVSLKVSLSSDSQLTLEHRCRHVIIPNIHRIYSLHLSDDVLIDQFFDQCRVDSSFNRLESIVLNGISRDKILVVLAYLNSLPQLSSLTIIPEEDFYYDLANIYRLIFRFPCLKYSKVSLLEQDESDIIAPMSINEKPSTITRLVLAFHCSIKELTSLIRHTPHLQYLSCENLVEADDDEEVNRNELRLALPHLTNISIDRCGLNFDQFEIFIKKISSQLRKFRLTTMWEPGYLDGNRWKQLIKKHMPHLYEFHLRSHMLLEDDTFFNGEQLNQFTSSFWTERQWFFEAKYTFGESVYIIHPRRETWFNFSTQSNNGTYLKPSILPIQFTLGYFTTVDEVQSYIDCIKSSSIVMPFTHLCVGNTKLPIDKLIEIIRVLPNLNSLEISSLPQFQSNDLSSNDSEMVLSVSIINKITKVKLNKMDETEQIHFLFDLFPHMQYFEVSCKTEDDLDNLVRSIIMNNITYIHDLKCLCICVPNADEKMVENLKLVIDFEQHFYVDKTFSNYTIQRQKDKIYLKWE